MFERLKISLRRRKLVWEGEIKFEGEQIGSKVQLILSWAKIDFKGYNLVLGDEKLHLKGANK